MSSGSDPASVLTTLDRAQDAFEMVGRGRTAFEDGISADEDWKTQLTKACRLLEVVKTLQSQDGYYHRPASASRAIIVWASSGARKISPTMTELWRACNSAGATRFPVNS